MKTDITGRRELEILINWFYEKVNADEVIGSFFTDINWERHLSVVYSFWENTLFFTGGYSGNPLKTHQALHQKYSLKEEHFRRWLELFIEAVDELYAGEKAELAKQRAASISTIMQIKIL